LYCWCLWCDTYELYHSHFRQESMLFCTYMVIDRIKWR
jgi:hypothetical protein